MKQKSRAVTLLELLIVVVLVSAVIFAIANMELFSRYQLTTSINRARLQNEVTFALEHMHKHILGAIGSAGDWPVLRDADGMGIRVRVDSNGNGQIDSADAWIAYRHENIGEKDSGIRFFPDITSNPSQYEVIAHKILRDSGSGETAEKGLDFIGNFNTTTNFLEDSILEIRITARWFSDEPLSVENPEVTMQTRISMPSVTLQ